MRRATRALRVHDIGALSNMEAYLKPSHGAVATDTYLYEPLCTSYLPYLMCLSHRLVTAGI